MLIDMGLLCLSLGAFSWAHSISVWSSWDDKAVIVVSGILAAIEEQYRWAVVFCICGACL